MAAELDFIQHLRNLATHPAARDLRDDCAVLKLGDETLVLTHDMMAAGVHFLPEQDPADIAWKLVAVNLSDLAAKGAKPVGVLLGYTLSQDDARFLEGLHEALAHYDIALLGGDTIAGTGVQVLGLTAIGTATHVPVPSRSGATPGDALYVTGPVGAAMMGHEALKSRSKEDTSAYRRPEARLAEGAALAPHVTAMMDISDGLLLDASRMALASEVSFKIDSCDVPIAAPEKRRQDALRWGDDYELLFTIPTHLPMPIDATRIGMAIASSSAPILLDGEALSDLATLGYQH